MVTGSTERRCYSPSRQYQAAHRQHHAALAQNFRWEVWQDPAVLLPSNFHVFPALKQQLSGTRFLCVDDVKTDAARWRRQQGYEFFVSGTDKLVVRSGKCLNRHGDCVKKCCLTSVVTSRKHFFAESQMQHAQSRTRNVPPFSSQDFSHAELTWEEGHLGSDIWIDV